MSRDLEVGTYWEAEVAASQVTTPPYLLYTYRKVGMTLTTRAQNGRAMIGADILLETLSATQKQLAHPVVVYASPTQTPCPRNP